jgi:hypothetical protein
MAPTSSLPITEAFASARAYLASEAARIMHVVSVTYCTKECGLVEFRLDGGQVVGQEVAA